MGYSASQIYQMLHSGQGNTGLLDTADTAAAQADTQNEINQKVLALNEKMSSAWSGTASEGAQTGATPLVKAASDASNTLMTTQDLTQRQAESFAVAKASVVNVPEQAPQYTGFNSVLHTLGIPNSTDSAVAQYNNQSSQNVTAYDEYNSASTYNADNMPTSYGAIAAENASITVVDPTSVGGGGVYTGSVGPQGAGAAAEYMSSYGGSSGSAGARVPAFGSGGGGSTYTGSGGSGGGGGVWQPPGGGTGLSSASGSGGSTGAGGGFNGSYPGAGGSGSGGGGDLPPGYRLGPNGELINPEGQIVGPNGQVIGPNGEVVGPNGEIMGPNGEVLSPGGGAGGLGGSGGGGGFGGAGGSGGGSGAGGLRGGLSGGAGSGAGGGTEGASGPGGRAGVGLNPEDAAMRGGVAGGVPGEEGSPGVGMGGRGGRREEDREHQTASYLQEADPDALFGTDQLTAPPVIGD